MYRAAPQRAAIRKITRSLVAQRPVEDSLGLLADEALRLTSASSTAICLLTPERDMLDYVVASGVNAAEMVGLRTRVIDSLSDTVVTTGESLRIASESSHSMGNLFTDLHDPRDTGYTGPRLVRRPAPKTIFGIRSAAIVPIFQDRTLVGTLSAVNKCGRRGGILNEFHSDDLETLQMLAEFATLSKLLERMIRLANERGRDLDVMLSSARIASDTHNRNQVFSRILDLICSRFDYRNAIVLAVDEEQRALTLACERTSFRASSSVSFPLEAPPSLDDPAISQVLITGLPALLTQPDDEFTDFDDDEGDLPYGAESAMIAPLCAGDAITGVVLLTSLYKNAYNAQDLALFAALADQAAGALARTS
jgi:GAF domain-containing protein